MNLNQALYKSIHNKLQSQKEQETISLQGRNCKDSIQILEWVVLVGVFKAIRVQSGDKAHLEKVRVDLVSILNFRWLHKQSEWQAWEVKTNQV